MCLSLLMQANNEARVSRMSDIEKKREAGDTDEAVIPYPFVTPSLLSELK